MRAGPRQRRALTTRGILLSNLGSPETAEPDSVRRYLGQFLMDRHVIDAPWPLRRLIVSLIQRRRPRETARAYRAIWRDEKPGSPLLHFSRRLAEALRRRGNAPLALGMRYGKPSLAEALARLEAEGSDEILLMPLYPQHAGATRTTTIERTRELLAPGRRLLVLPPFHARSEYLAAMRRQIAEHLPPSADFVLFSFHGLPERQILRADAHGHCLRRPDCCEAPSPAHGTCYRHQCRATARALGGELPVPYGVSFQSRLGRLPWLRPYTEERIGELAGSGVRRLAVVCPSFVADNLETLEEIAIRGASAFRDAGGERLTLVPCLNDSSAWVEALARWSALPASDLETA